jgi:hypothetical protein
LTPSLEDSNGRTAKARRVQHHELFYEDKIDQIFCAAALVTLPISSGVCVDLLRDVLFERQDRHFDWLDIGECQEVRRANGFRLPPQRVRESDVDHDFSNRLPPNPARTRYLTATPSSVSPDAPTFSMSKSEEVIEIDSLSGDEVGGGRRFVVAANEVHVFRSPRAFSRPELEGQRSLENPAVWRGDREAYEEAIEYDRLSQADQRSAPVTRSHE